MNMAETTTAEQQAEAGMVALGNRLEWTENEYRRASHAHIDNEHWFEVSDTSVWHDDPGPPFCALYSSPSNVSICKTAYWTNTEAKAACEIHAATGKWE